MAVYLPIIQQLVVGVPCSSVGAKCHVINVLSHRLCSGTEDPLSFKHQSLAAPWASISNLMSVWTTSVGISSPKTNRDVFRETREYKVTYEYGAPSTQEDLSPSWKHW